MSARRETLFEQLRASPTGRPLLFRVMRDAALLDAGFITPAQARRALDSRARPLSA